MSLIGFWQWLRFLFTLIIWVSQLYMAYVQSYLRLTDSPTHFRYQAFIGASGVTLQRFHLPYIGFIAEDWVTEE